MLALSRSTSEAHPWFSPQGDQGERDIPSSSGAVGENPAGHIHAEASERIGRRKQCDLCVGYAHGLLLKIVEGVAEVRDQVDASTRY